MKKTLKKLIFVLLLTLALVSCFISCDQSENPSDTVTDKPSVGQGVNQTQSQNQNQSPSSGTDSSKPSETESNASSGNIEIDSYKEQVSYYMALTESLQAELLKLKEDTYIDECEYQLQISTLEDTVEMLKSTIASLSGSGLPSLDTQAPSNDQLSSKPQFKYTINEGKVTLTEYIGKALDVTIPESIDGMPVTAIGEEAFKGLQIRSVVIPSGVKEIGWFAFSGCTVLESVSIPSSVLSVGYGAFEYCPRSLVISCEKSSYIEAYAISWGMKVLAK